MVKASLAQSYLQKARTRLKILPALLAEEGYSDVIREAQEIVELALKGMLRQVGVSRADAEAATAEAERVAALAAQVIPPAGTP